MLVNDQVFDDKNTGDGQTLVRSQQVLDSAFDGSYNAGQDVRSVFCYNVTNNTTGYTGTAYLIRIYTGSNPVSQMAKTAPTTTLLTYPFPWVTRSRCHRAITLGRWIIPILLCASHPAQRL